MTVLTRLPGTAGQPQAYAMDVQFDGTGRYLAVITAPYPDLLPGVYPPGAVTWYRRDGDTLVPLPSPAALPTAPYTCRWTPNGRHLVVATRSGTPNLPAEFDTTSRIWLYRRDGDTLVLLGSVPDAFYDPGFDIYTATASGRRLSFPYGGWGFDATGTRLVTGSVGGLQALLRLTGDTLTITSGYRTGVFRASWTAGFHPVDPALIHLQLAPAIGQPAVTVLARVTGEDFPEVAFAEYRGSDSGKSLAWHPAGESFLSPQDKLESLGGGGGVAPWMYRYDAARLGQSQFVGVQRLGYLEAFTGVYTGYSYDPGGTWLAGGPAYDGTAFGQLPGDFGAAHGGDGSVYYAGGRWLGLTVAAVDGRPAGEPGDINYSRPYTAVGEVLRSDACAGMNTSWAAGTGALYLAAGGGFRGDGSPDLLPGGICLFRIDAAPVAPASTLYVRQPDGEFALVGTDSRPHSIRLPDGTMRTWPGSTSPLYMCMPDGTWRQVVGPTVEVTP